MKKLSLLSALLFLYINLAFAGGPWPQQKGKGYYKLSEWWTVFDQHFTDAGLVDPNVTTGVFNTSFYGEYGITDRFTGMVNAALFSRNYMNNLRSATTNEIIVPGEAINTIGDIDVGIKYGLTETGARTPVALSLVLGLPTGTVGGGTQGNLQTGDGEFNQIIQVDAGRGFMLGKHQSYLSAYVGFNNRTNDFSEEFRYGLDFGVGLMDSKLWLSTKVNAIESFQNGATAATTTSTSLFANNTEYIGITLEANYYLTKRFGISGTMAGAAKARIIAAAPSYSVGVFFDMSK